MTLFSQPLLCLPSHTVKHLNLVGLSGEAAIDCHRLDLCEDRKIVGSERVPDAGLLGIVEQSARQMQIVGVHIAFLAKS